MLKNAPIVILDEAAAYTDPENERELIDAVEALTKEKTIIMIAHRLKRYGTQIKSPLLIRATLRSWELMSNSCAGGLLQMLYRRQNPSRKPEAVSNISFALKKPPSTVAKRRTRRFRRVLLNSDIKILYFSAASQNRCKAFCGYELPFSG